MTVFMYNIGLGAFVSAYSAISSLLELNKMVGSMSSSNLLGGVPAGAAVVSKRANFGIQIVI
jgi:hypothetical protein